MNTIFDILENNEFKRVLGNGVYGTVFHGYPKYSSFKGEELFNYAVKIIRVSKGRKYTKGRMNQNRYLCDYYKRINEILSIEMVNFEKARLLTNFEKEKKKDSSIKPSEEVKEVMKECEELKKKSKIIKGGNRKEKKKLIMECFRFIKEDVYKRNMNNIIIFEKDLGKNKRKGSENEKGGNNKNEYDPNLITNRNELAYVVSILLDYTLSMFNSRTSANDAKREFSNIEKVLNAEVKNICKISSPREVFINDKTTIVEFLYFRGKLKLYWSSFSLYFLKMPIYKGNLEDMHRIIFAKKKRIDFQLKLKWCWGVLMGLSSLHHLDICHKDIKNDNVFIDSCENLVLADYALNSSLIAKRDYSYLPLKDEKSIEGKYEYEIPEKSTKFKGLELEEENIKGLCHYVSDIAKTTVLIIQILAIETDEKNLICEFLFNFFKEYKNFCYRRRMNSSLKAIKIFFEEYEDIETKFKKNCEVLYDALLGKIHSVDALVCGLIENKHFKSLIQYSEDNPYLIKKIIDLERKVVSLETQVNTLQKTVNRLNKRIEEQNKRFEKQNKRIEEQNKRIEEQNKTIEGLIMNSKRMKYLLSLFILMFGMVFYFRISICTEYYC